MVVRTEFSLVDYKVCLWVGHPLIGSRRLPSRASYVVVQICLCLVVVISVLYHKKAFLISLIVAGLETSPFAFVLTDGPIGVIPFMAQMDSGRNSSGWISGYARCA